MTDPLDPIPPHAHATAMTWKQRIKKSPLVLWTISGPIETHVSVSKRESIQTLKYLEQRGVDPVKGGQYQCRARVSRDRHRRTANSKERYNMIINEGSFWVCEDKEGGKVHIIAGQRGHANHPYTLCCRPTEPVHETLPVGYLPDEMTLCHECKSTAKRQNVPTSPPRIK